MSRPEAGQELNEATPTPDPFPQGGGGLASVAAKSPFSLRGGGGAGDARVFCEPWEAQAFALVVALQDQGIITAAEWAQALGAEVHGGQAAPDGHDYYELWLAALEKLLATKGIASETTVGQLAASWERAAHATPHGKPILLENDPLHSRS